MRWGFRSPRGHTEQRLVLASSSTKPVGPVAVWSFTGSIPPPTSHSLRTQGLWGPQSPLIQPHGAQGQSGAAWGGAASPRSGEAALGTGRWEHAAIRKTPSSGSRSLEGKHPQPQGSVPHGGTQDQPPLFPLLPLPGCRAAVFSLRSVRL